MLHNLLEPVPLPPPQSRAELAREERSTLIETAKDRWNEEVETAVRWVQRTDWNEMREGMEGAISRLLGSGLQNPQDGIDDVEKHARPKVQEAIDRSKAAAEKAVFAADAKSGAPDAVDFVRSGGGTVNAARGAVRSVIQKGIEKGKEAIGKAQEAVGLATEDINLAVHSAVTSQPSSVEKALDERYHKPDGLDRSVEQTLEDRYKPIDSRENTALRGV